MEQEPIGGLALAAEGKSSWLRWSLRAAGKPAAYVLVFASIYFAFWYGERQLPGSTVAGLFATMVLGLLAGGDLAGSQVSRLQAENDRLTAEVKRVSDEKSRIQTSGLENPRSSSS